MADLTDLFAEVEHAIERQDYESVVKQCDKSTFISLFCCCCCYDRHTRATLEHMENTIPSTN